MIAIAICTHNPDERLLARTLSAIASQTVTPDECVLVDNGSEPAIASLDCVSAFLRTHAWARVVMEPRRGLSYARAAAIDATTASAVCFVDDDNEPASDYIAAAQRILRERACIAAIGPGKVTVDYIDPVPEWFARKFSHHFQEKQQATLAYGCAGAGWTDYYPHGSCMVVKRDVLLQYREGVLSGRLSAVGHSGRRLTSGDDTQIVWEAVRMGWAAGTSPELQIRHLIPARRATLAYMRRLLYGTSSSYLPALVSSFPEQRDTLPAIPSQAEIASKLAKITARHVISLRWKFLPLALATYAGSVAGLIRASGATEPKALRLCIRGLRLE